MSGRIIPFPVQMKTQEPGSKLENANWVKSHNEANRDGKFVNQTPTSAVSSSEFRCKLKRIQNKSAGFKKN